MNFDLFPTLCCGRTRFRVQGQRGASGVHNGPASGRTHAPDVRALELPNQIGPKKKKLDWWGRPPHSFLYKEEPLCTPIVKIREP